MAIPVSLTDAKRQLRVEVDSCDRDREIADFISDAAAWIEGYSGQVLVAREVSEQFANFDRLELRAWPIKAGAALSVEYRDKAGVTIGVGSRLSAVRRPVSVIPAAGTRWPCVGVELVSVTVRAGYEPGDAVPGNIRRAMLVLIAAYDADREGGEVFAKAEDCARGLINRANLRLRRL